MVLLYRALSLSIKLLGSVAVGVLAVAEIEIDKISLMKLGEGEKMKKEEEERLSYLHLKTGLKTYKDKYLI